MNLLPFDLDQGFGDVDQTRVVVLRGTTTVSQLFSPNLFDVFGWMRTWLESLGFSVNAIRHSAAGYVGYSNNIEIELNVDLAYSAEQARQSAITAIESVTANYGLNNVFSNTTLSVVYDAYRPPVTSTGGSSSRQPATSSGGSSPRPVQSPPSSYDQNQSATDFGSNLGLGLGISTPIAIGGAALLALVLLRK